MAKTNTVVATPPIFTHEGARAVRVNPELQLRRSVMSCMLWEGEFYEDGVSIAKRITEMLVLVEPQKVADIAVEARTKMKLRHVPLLIAREMARLPEHKKLVADLLPRIIQRADELAEFLALYWKDGKQPLSAQVKRGLAKAFLGFSAYDLAKYNRDAKVKLKDVMFLAHPTPNAEGIPQLLPAVSKPKYKRGAVKRHIVGQGQTWFQLIEGTLASPDTWEVELSKGGEDKKASWTRLLTEKKLGALALLRNLRNMQQAKVDDKLIREALQNIKVERVLPFRFVSAAAHNPKLEPELEVAMLKCLAGQKKLAGKTVLVIDVSGSMGGSISGKSELQRVDAAAALAMLVREVCEDAAIYCTAGNDFTRIHQTQLIPARRGFALRDSVRKAASKLGGGGIFLKQCMDFTHAAEITADRVIVFTDEQDCDTKCNPDTAVAFGKQNYLVNVASYKNGIGYGKWTHVDGFSEAVIDFIAASEAQ